MTLSDILKEQAIALKTVAHLHDKKILTDTDVIKGLRHVNSYYLDQVCDEIVRIESQPIIPGMERNESTV